MADLLTDQNGFRRRLNDDHDESNDQVYYSCVILYAQTLSQDASKRAKRSPSTSSSCSSSSSASSSSSSDSSIGATREETFVSTLFPPEPPKFASSLTHQIRRRQIALRKQSQLKRHFHKQAAARFRLEKVLPGHAGCVNALGWSTNGQMIVSGSDDTRLCIHAPFSAQKTPLAQIDTDHQMNIFQSKFVPYTNDRMIVSASRDGLVSLTQLDQTGQLVRFDADHCGNAIIQHSQACHKLCFVPGTQTILTCGEDGNVFRYDPRESVSSSTGRGLRPFLKYKSDQHERHGGTEHNAIDFNKSGSQHFALGGRYHAALVYDYRVVKDATQSQYTEPIAEIAPEHIFRMRSKFDCPHITALRYSNSGDKLLMSYNDENIHLYDIKEDRFEHAFEGHRNHQTVKGVNFYGQHSEFVISGSDCGNLYVWDAKTGELVNWQASVALLFDSR